MAVALCSSPTPSGALGSRQVITVPSKPAKTVKDSVEMTGLWPMTSLVDMKLYGVIDIVVPLPEIVVTSPGSDEMVHA